MTAPRAERPPEEARILDTTVWGILEDAAVRHPEASALVDGSDRGRRWSYATLAELVRHTALALEACFEPRERLAVCAPSSPESLVLTYAAAASGLVLVPVNPALRAGELAHVLESSSAAGLFTVSRWRDQDVRGVVDGLRPRLPALREVVEFADFDEFRRSADPRAPLRRHRPGPDDVAQIVYTSGTTGVPKGAELTHRGMTNAARLAAQRFEMRAGDVYLHTMPLFHVGGQVVSFQICQQGAAAVLMESFDAGAMLELIAGERATLTCGVPTMLLALVEHPDFAQRDLSSLRAVSSGGAVVPTELVRDLEAALGIRFAIVFGQTEACGFISQTRLDDPDEVKAASLGTPLPALAARVVDDGGEVLGLGQVGELEVRGPNVMAGYHGLPEESAQAIDPEGWLRTGDLVDMDGHGVLRIRGRRKDMIVSGGENIFPVEIEEALVRHPAVAQAAVVGVAHRRWGESAVAVVRLAPGATVTAEELERYARTELAAFKVPRRWHFVEELPLTASGKVQKFVLRQRLGEDGSLLGGGSS